MSMAMQEPRVDLGPFGNAAPQEAVVPGPAQPSPVAPLAPSPGVTPDPAAAAALFGNYADEPLASPSTDQPRRVKTQTIHPDAGPLKSAIANASNLGPKQLSTAASTAGQILEETGTAGVTNLNQAAYILATARRESLMGNVMNEGGGNAYFESHYGPHTDKGQELGNTQPGDGARYHGRGLVQVTGRNNYTMWNDRLRKEGVTHNGEEVDLVNNPEQATERDIASRVLVEGMRDGTFTKKKLGSYVNDTKTDYRNARRIVNGMDHADEIAAQATSYQGILNANSDEYTNAVIKGQTRNLPTAQDGSQLTAQAATTDMLNPTPMGGTPGGFVKPHKLLRSNLGHFEPAAAPKNLTTLKTHPVE